MSLPLYYLGYETMAIRTHHVSDTTFIREFYSIKEQISNLPKHKTG